MCSVLSTELVESEAEKKRQEESMATMPRWIQGLEAAVATQEKSWADQAT